MQQPLLVTGGYDNTLRLWRADNGACVRSLQHNDSQVNCLDISPDRSIIAAGGHLQTRFYDARSSSTSPYSFIEGHTNNITSMGFFKNGINLFSVSEDHTVKVWDIRSTSEHQKEFTHEYPVTCACLHPNQHELIAGDQHGAIVRWNLQTNSCTEVLIPVPNVALRSIAVSPDGKYLAIVNNQGTCFLWSIGAGDFVAHRSIDAHPHAIGLKCRFSPDSSKLITTGSDKTARLLDGARGFVPGLELPGHGAWVWDAAFSGDGAFVVTVSSDKFARMWDTTQGHLALELKGHQKAITAVALHDA